MLVVLVVRLINFITTMYRCVQIASYIYSWMFLKIPIFRLRMNKIIKVMHILPGIDIFRELQKHTAMTDESIVLKLAEAV